MRLVICFATSKKLKLLGRLNNPEFRRKVLEKVEKSTKYVDGKYQVAIPWKDDEPEPPDNYKMAVRRAV